MELLEPWIEQSDDPTWLPSAESLTAEHSPLVAEPRFELSRRERQVLDFIRLGLTNRQIAQRLFVSTNTVNKHVHQVLRKLDVSDRVQAATHMRALSN